MEDRFATRACHAGREDFTEIGVHAPPLDLSTVSRPAEARRDFWQHDDRLEDGTPVSVLEIRGDMPRSRAQELEERIWERIGRGRQLAVEKLGQFHDGLATAQSHSLGLAQLVLLWRIVDGQRGQLDGPRSQVDGQRSQLPPAARAEAVSRPDVTEPGLRAAAARS